MVGTPKNAKKARKIASEHGLLVDVDVISEPFYFFLSPFLMHGMIMTGIRGGGWK